MTHFLTSAPVPAFLDTLLAHGPDGCGFLDQHLCFGAVSARLAEINGPSVSEHLGRSAAEVLGPALWEVRRPLLERALAGEEIVDAPLEGRADAPGSEAAALRVSYYPVRLGEAVVGVAVVVRDVSAQQKAARREQAFVRDVLASVTDGRLWVCASAADLPPAGHAVGEAIALTPDGGLYALRRLAESVAAAAGHSAARQNDLMIAASEAGMNAIVHAGGGSGQVSVNASGTVQVRIVDYGGGITLENLPRAMLARGFSTKATLGQGLKMLMETIDRLFLLTGPAGTTLVLEQDRAVLLPALIEL